MKGFTRDISRDGMFIQTHHPFPPGSEVEVELLYEDQPISVSAVVVHAARTPPHLQGIQVSGMGVRMSRPEATDSPSGNGSSPSVPEEDPSAGRDERVDPGTRVVVFFGSQRRVLALRSLSASGAAIVGEEALPPVPFVRMQFKLSGQPDLVVDGVPVRSEDIAEGILVAVKFLEPPPDVVARIEDFVERNRLRAPGGD